MVEFPTANVTLSKTLAHHKMHRGAYARYQPVKRVACHECIAVLHEAKGVGQPPLGAKHKRTTPVGVLPLCGPHNDLWRAIDGIGKARPKR
jgi:hypothetical protein